MLSWMPRSAPFSIGPRSPLMQASARATCSNVHCRASMPSRQHFRAALKLSLDQWAQRQAGTLGNEPAFTRGHRVDLLRDAIAPLRGRVSEADFDRLAKALSLLFGIEALIVMKDIWGASAEEAQDIVQWAAAVLVRSIAPA